MSEKVEIQKICPLTSTQEGMFFHWLMHTDAQLFLSQLSFRVSGELRIDLFEQSFNILIERHEVIRSIFRYQNLEQPLQVFLKKRVAKIDYRDISTVNNDEQTKLINEFICDDREKSFDITKNILMRITIWRFSQSSYQIIWSWHHIIMDGWSMPILMREFTEIYLSLKNNQPLNLERAYPYSDYIKWLEKQDKEAASSYWKGYLDGYQQLALLPNRLTDERGSEQKEFLVELPENITKKLKEIASQNSVTLSTVFQSIWGILLQNYNWANDVVFGMVTSGRPPELPGVEKMVGLFINTIPVRITSKKGQLFTGLLRQVQEQAVISEQFSYYSLAEIQSETELKEKLIDSVIVFENYPIENEVLAQYHDNDLGFRLHEYKSIEQTFYHLDILITASHSIAVKLKYNAAVYHLTTIQRVAADIRNMAEHVCKNPAISIAELYQNQGISHEHQITPTLEFEPFQLESEAAIGARFESQAGKYPDQIAIKMGKESYTYEELNRQANRIGRVILETETETVGLVFGHGPEMVAAMLGALKSGKIYIPLDPAYPESQINYILENAGVQTIITHQKYLQKAEDLNPSSPMRIINIDELDPRIPGENIPKQVNPERPAYIMYTSGSTGLPKGVIQSHRNILKLIGSYTNLLRLNRRDRIALFTSYSHAVGVIDILSAILNGATLYPYDLKSEGSMEGLSQWIRAEEITVYHSVPTVYRYWLDNAEAGTRFSKLRLIILGGEALHPKDVERYRRHFEDQCLLVNLFGSSEVLIATAYIMDKQVELKRATVPVGYFIDGVTAVILDSDEEVGVYGTGEIVYQSKYLALGYWKMPEQTKAVFGETGDGKRLYRSGDLGRFLPDGSLEFIGRRDSQVKVRGYRIELAGIEQILDTCIGIQKSVVTVWHGDQDEQIVAYYQTTGGIQIDVEELRAELAQKLPDYMIPDYYIYLNQLPMTANGKIDRKALPKPDRSNRNQREYEAPRDETEGQLAEIWQELLGVQRIGINDHFFELGGHSLKATSLVSRIHKNFNVEVPLQEIFKTPTIKGLSTYLASAKQSKYSAIQRVAPREYYPVSSAQKRMYILNQIEGSGTSYNTPGATLVEGKLEKETLAEIFQKLIQRHETLRTSFEMHNGEPAQKIHPRVEFHIEGADSNGGADSNPRLQNDGYGTGMPVPHIPDIIRNFIRPFDLSQAPLLRVGLIRINEAKHILLYDLHHIISDGTSMGILVREFISLYNEEELPPLRIQYKDFSEWQNQLFQTGILRKQEEYWLNQFQGEIPVLNLPTDEPRPIIQSFEGNRHEFAVDQETSRQINQLASDTGTTLFMIILAAYNILLSKYSGQEDIIIGSPIAGRVHTDLDNIIGMFVNTLAFRNYPVGQKTFRQFLTEVKENSLKAYANQDYQFEELVEKLDLKRDLSRNPLFDVMFVLQNIDSHFREIRDLKFQPYPVKNTTAKFDLTLQAMEGKDGIYFSLEYGVKIFKAETIARMAGDLQNILRAIVIDPEINLSAIEMITGAEKRRILYEFNDTAAEYPREKTIHRLFEEQAERTPENIAVVFGEKHLTYRELNQKANQLARVLQHKGVKKGEIIAISGEHSIETIIGLLSILKAGGAYLPIDPEYPPERIEYMIKDSGTKFLLTDCNQIITQLEARARVIGITNSETPTENQLMNQSEPKDPAYVIYTSGSTGKPKGVMVSHRGLTNYICWSKKEYMKEAKLDFPLYSSLSFDLTVTSIFTPLISGGKIFIYKQTNKADQIVKIINEDKVGVIKLTPTHLKILKNYEVANHNLKRLIVGGEDLKTELAQAITTKFRQPIEIINEYGPTETVVGCMIYRYDPEKDRRNSVPIGAPADNVQIYILDKYLNPSMEGELYISGDGVAFGYINQPELTHEKFIMNPFIPGERMYRTGDLARWLPDGNIEFLGRIDHQVKIRGFRIELGEIEKELLKHEAITEAVVIAREGVGGAKEDGTSGAAGGEKYLCAYIIGERELKVQELRGHLSQRLPEYMIPSYFIQLHQFPMTPNGKIDRKAIAAYGNSADSSKWPQPEGSIKTRVEYEAPRNETEEKLVVLWREVLVLEKIGINDNFFELGGHSLKATTLVSKIHKVFNRVMPLSEIFQKPTIGEQAEYLEKAKKSFYEAIRAVKEGYPDGRYPVSSAQKRLYIVNQFEPEQTHYNMPGITKLKGKINKDRLEEVFQRLIGRHESLRTSFEMFEGKLIQRIHSDVKFEISYQESEAKEVEAIYQEFIKPFDLAQAPLLKVKLVRIVADEYLLMHDMHHIISDGASMGLLIREFGDLYEGRELQELRIQYKDYAVWQKELLQSDGIKGQEKYWRDNFTGEIPVLNLPLDYPRPNMQSFEGDRIRFEAEAGTTLGIKELGQKNGVTVFMILLAAYNILLSKYSGQDDIIIGSPIAGRPHADLDNVIGMFVNTLALRNYPDGTKTFQEFLTGVKEKCLGAYENQDYQFEELVEKLNLPRDLSRNPLFDVMFVLQNIDINRSMIQDLQFSSYELEDKKVKFDLTLTAAEVGAKIQFSFDYCARLFKRETVERMAGHMQNILQTIVANPDQRLADIEMLSEAEKRNILYEFNDTRAGYPKDKTLPELFEEQVSKTPENIAVVYEDQTLTYRHLNHKANQLAAMLRAKGVKSGEIVGIMAKRSLEMIIGIIGILKAGGAYLPIDPEYPADRITYMLRDSHTRLLLGQTGLVQPGHFWGEVIPLDGNDAIWDNHDNNFTPMNQSTDLAYVIYTSGSIGEPKGVLIEHRSIINTIHWRTNCYEFDEKDAVLQMPSFAFDSSVEDIFSTLLAGAKLILIHQDKRNDLEYITNLLKKHEISHFLIVPSFYKIMLQELKNDLHHLRSITVAGESFDEKLVTDHFKRFPEVKLYNEYGPTENSVCTTFYQFDLHNNRVLIGKPINNTLCAILNPDHKIQPIGVPGELCIAGEGLSRGYLNRPELTAEKFIPNPIQFQTSNFKLHTSIIYRTGDYGRWLPDRNIEFLGRIDHQVKIRGFRIELGEIETQLIQHETVKEAVVIAIERAGVAKEDGTSGAAGGEKYLCAYLVGEREQTVPELREYLARTLPEYMIPSYFIYLSKMPLTPNGKIDRRSLPDTARNLNTGVAYEAPRNDIERKLAAIWQEVLGMERVGINDNFFELGGHSLKATILVSKIHKAINRELPLREVFQQPTLRRQAEYLQGKTENLYETIQPATRGDGYPEGCYPLASAQKRLHILHQMEADPTSYNMPGAIAIEGDIKPERLKEVFRQLIARHESLRTSFRLVDGEPIQHIQPATEFELEYWQTGEAEINPPACARIIQGFVRPFDLGQAPLLRVGLIEIEQQKKSILIYDMHHIIADGTSMGILIDEFVDLYEGKELTPLRIQYKDYAGWQRDQIRSGFIKAQEAYWLHNFAGEIPVLNLPTDHPRPTVRNFAGNRFEFEIDAELSGGLKQIAALNGATLFMVLLAVYNVFLAKYSGQEDLIIGTPIAGRPHADLEHIIGMFVNTLALRNRPESRKSFLEFLNEVKENALQAYENQDYQFEELVEKLNLRRDISRNPIFDVMFILQNIDTGSKRLTDLRITPYPMESHTAKFDLTLFAAEGKERLFFVLEYSTQLYERKTIEKMIQYFKNLLREIINNPDQPIRKMDMLSKDEKNEILSEISMNEKDISIEFKY